MEVVLPETVVTDASPLEKRLLEIWAQILKIEENRIGLNTNFFDVGGDSIKTLSLTSLINKTLDMKITVADVFKYTTVASFAEFVSNGDTVIEIHEQQIARESDEMNEALTLLTNF
jgi:iturin family lipopeptide synthetase C